MGVTLPLYAVLPRGRRPYRIPHVPGYEREILEIPGVARAEGGGFEATYDAAVVVYQMFGWPLGEVPSETAELPGLDAYSAKRLHERQRGYQWTASSFLANRPYGILAHPMRVGKTLSALGAVELVGAKRVCVVCPSIAKYVWTSETWKWLGEEALVLEGRSLREARTFCGACLGSGRVTEQTPLGPRTKKCPSCIQRNGQSYGYRLHLVDTLDVEDGGVRRCRKHPSEKTEEDAGVVFCRSCQLELQDRLLSARFVIVNPDILVPQRTELSNGRKVLRRDMPGFGKLLAAVGYDTVIVDEAHMFRARPQMSKAEANRRDEKEFRAEALADIGRSATRMWGLTGTPIYAYTRDIYMLLHIFSHGVWGDPKQFDKYYCQGKFNEWGSWDNTGKSWKAESELPWRLKFYMLKAELRDLRPELPAKQRTMRRYDAPAGLSVKKFKANVDPVEMMRIAIDNTAAVKRDAVVEEVLGEMSEGRKVVVFTYHKRTAKAFFDAFEHATKRSKSWKARMQSVGAMVWLADGEVSPKNRVAMGQRFVAHQSAGVFVATIEAFQVAVSLAGASTVHFADLHPIPGAILQAEARPEDGTTPLTVVYHVVNASIDEQCMLDLQEKIEQIDSVVGDKDAAALAATFGTIEEELKDRAEKMFARLLADLNG